MAGKLFIFREVGITCKVHIATEGWLCSTCRKIYICVYKETLWCQQQVHWP